MARSKTRTRGVKSRRRSKRGRGVTRNKRRRKCPCQRGGICFSGSCVAMGAMGAMKMMGAGWVGKNVYRKYKSHSSRSSYRRSGNKRKIKRSENLELVESNKRKSFRKSFRIEQDNEKVTVNGKERKYRTLKEATEKYNQVIKKCLKKGFRRC